MNWVLDSLLLRKYPMEYRRHARDGGGFYFDRHDLKKRI